MKPNFLFRCLCVEMQPTHHCFLAGAVFLSLVSSTLTFSRGASYASCQDMTPGHISAHPLDPKQNHITLRTSASSYLPGQLLTGVETGVTSLYSILSRNTDYNMKPSIFRLICIHSYSSKLSGLHGLPAPGP